MSKLKKLLASLLAVAMLASIGTTVMAEDVGQEETIGKVILNSQIFNPDGTKKIDSQSGIQPFAIEYNPGTIKIDDILQASSGIYMVDSKTATQNALSNTFMAIMPYIPYVGPPLESMSMLFGLVKDYYSIFDSADYSRGVTIDTKYSYRLFYHVINAYTDQYAWREVGTSLSKYYYRHTTATAYCRDRGDYVTESVDYTHSNGYAPTTIQKAPNYMNYSNLQRYGYEAYATGRSFTEIY